MNKKLTRQAIDILLDRGVVATKNKKRALKAHNDSTAYYWDEVKANTRDEAIKLIKELLK